MAIGSSKTPHSLAYTPEVLGIDCILTPLKLSLLALISGALSGGGKVKKQWISCGKVQDLASFQESKLLS